MNVVIRVLLVALVLALSGVGARATTLWPELKAYDFAQAYYVEDGGVVIAPYPYGFYCPHGIETPEGIRVMPGVGFVQLAPDRRVWEQYTLLRTDGHRAWFTERLYHFHFVDDKRGRLHPIREREFATDDFYLTRWRSLEWFDFAFGDLKLQPGLEEWRTR